MTKFANAGGRIDTPYGHESGFSRGFRMFRLGRSIRTIEAIEKQSVFQQFNSRIIEVRPKFQIVVVDDKTFTPQANLMRNKYDITHIQDISSINAIENYPIVLCDLLGVGVSLSPTLQGAHIIAEIKKSYPEKIVVAYTGGGYSDIYEAGVSIADHHLKKDANIEEWCDLLDTAISELSNPAIVWRKTRHRLLDADVTPYQLALLEDTFVRNVLKGREELELKLTEQANKLNLVGHAQSIINSLLASAIFAWIF